MNEHQFTFANLRQAVEHMIVRYSEEMLAYDRNQADEECKAASANVERARERYEATLTVLARLLGVPFAGLDEEEIA